MDDSFVKALFEEDAEDQEDADPIPEEVAAETTERAHAFRAAVRNALDALASKEHIEIAEGTVELLADEITLAGLDARTPRHALKKLRGALMDSDHVEEVYADNRVIEAAFRRAMGG